MAHICFVYVDLVVVDGHADVLARGHDEVRRTLVVLEPHAGEGRGEHEVGQRQRAPLAISGVELELDARDAVVAAVGEGRAEGEDRAGLKAVEVRDVGVHVS